MKKVALVIGHNLRSQGAYSKKLNKTEYEYWKSIAEKISSEIDVVDVYERKSDCSYAREMREVLKQINSKNYDYILELHFNSASSKKAKGSECLCFWRNKKGQEKAARFMEMLKEDFEIPTRRKWNKINGEIIETEGILLVQNSKVRGGYGICNSKGTYILLEPFFASNPEESGKFKDKNLVANFFAKFIKEELS